MTSSSPVAPRRDQSAWHGWFFWGLALPVVAYLSQVIYLWGFTIDDVAITYRYALHLANGHGLVWNPGGTPVEGYSNFLWVLILAAAGWLGLNIETSAAILSALLGLASLLLLYFLCRRLWAPRRFWWLPVLLVAATPEWTMWAVSGLEIPLYCTFLLAALLGLTSKNAARTWVLSIALPGLILVRPEGLPMACIVLACGILAEPGAVRGRLSAYAMPVLTTLGTALGLLIFRLVYFHSPLPNTVYAKFSADLPSLGRVGEWLLFGIPFLLAWGIALRSIRSQEHRWVLVAAITLAIAQMAAVLPVVPVMYFLHRYQIAFLPLLVLAVPSVYVLASRSRRWIAPTMLIVMLVWTLKEWPQVNVWAQTERYWRQTRHEVAQALAPLSPDAKVALIDAGFVPYWSDLQTLDVWGLCDRRAARQGFSPEATMERIPTSISWPSTSVTMAI